MQRYNKEFREEARKSDVFAYVLFKKGMERDGHSVKGNLTAEQSATATREVSTRANPTGRLWESYTSSRG